MSIEDKSKAYGYLLDIDERYYIKDYRIDKIVDLFKPYKVIEVDKRKINEVKIIRW